jgi:hypothetical protein
MLALARSTLARASSSFGLVARLIDRDKERAGADFVAFAEVDLIDDAGYAGGDVGLPLRFEHADGLDAIHQRSLLRDRQLDVPGENDLGRRERAAAGRGRDAALAAAGAAAEQGAGGKGDAEQPKGRKHARPFVDLAANHVH